MVKISIENKRVLVEDCSNKKYLCLNIKSLKKYFNKGMLDNINEDEMNNLHKIIGIV